MLRRRDIGGTGARSRELEIILRRRGRERAKTELSVLDSKTVIYMRIC